MTDETKSLATVKEIMTIDDFKSSLDLILDFTKKQLREGADGDGDYGLIKGTKKKTLYKRGAEKIARLFGLVPSFEEVSVIEDFDKGFVFYKYKCILTDFKTGKKVGEIVRSSNSKEKVYGTYETVFEKANKVEARAQKRALVAAVITATNASQIFDADANGEYDNTPPDKPTTAEEDPRRNRLNMKLWATANEHGWTEKFIHVAIKKKWNVESITNISNEQIEELTEFIVTKYQAVGKGNKPILREPLIVKEKAQEGEIVEKPAPDSQPEVIETKEPVEEKPIAYFCKGKKHTPQTQVKTTVENPWCTPECQDSFYTGSKNNERMDYFIKNGKLPAVNMG